MKRALSPVQARRGERTAPARAAERRTGAVSGLPEYAFDAQWHTAAIAVLVLSFILRMLLLGRFQLAADEAYYWDWSRRLALGYYDQGPMIGYVIRLTTMLFGVNEFGVRFGVLAASTGATICAYLLARRIFSPMSGFLTVVMLVTTPLMHVGSLIATYDPLQVFFWALAVLFLERALFADRPVEQNRGWTLAGIATGLGFLSKHTMLFLVPCLLLFLFTSPSHRGWLLRPQPYLAFLWVPLLYTGVTYWNYHHHWWTFRHLLFLVKKTNGTPLRRLGDLIGSQALLIGPVVFLGGLIACGRTVSLNARTAGGQRCRFLACMGAPVLLLFCMMTMKSKVQANWPACAWLTPIVLWSGWLTSWAGQRRASAWRAAGLAAFGVLFGLFLTAGVMIPGIRLGLGIRIAPDKDQSNMLFGWRELAARVQQIRDQEKGRRLFLVGNGYQYCALLAFYLPDHPETHDLLMHNRLNMYTAYNERLKDHLGDDAIFIDDNESNDRDLRAVFERVEWEPPFEQWRRDVYPMPIRTVHIARCRNYRLWTGLKWADGG